MGIPLLLTVPSERTHGRTVVGEITLSISTENVENVRDLYREYESIRTDIFYIDPECSRLYGNPGEVRKLNEYLVKLGLARADGDRLHVRRRLGIEIRPVYCV
jgi:hypothetical protein